MQRGSLVVTVFVLCTVGTCVHCVGTNGAEKVSVAAFWEQNSYDVQTAFNFGIVKHNTNKNRKYELLASIDIINTADAFKLSRIICKSFARGIAGMVGLVNPDSFQTFHAYINTFNMTFVTTWYPPKLEKTPSDYAIRMQPDLNGAILDTVAYYGWKNIIYLYNSPEGLIRLQSIFQGLTFTNDSLRISLVKKINSAKDALNILRSLEQTNRWSQKYVILDCPANLAKDVIISHVRDVHMGRRTYHYLLPALVFDEPWDPSVVEFGAVNITGFRLVDPERPIVKEFLANFTSSDSSTFPTPNRGMISATAALIYDGFLVLQETFSRMLEDNTQAFKRNVTNDFNCGSEMEMFDGIRTLSDASDYIISGTGPDFLKTLKPFENGQATLQMLKSIQLEGLTGNIEFSGNGTRDNYSIDVIEINTSSQKVKIGKWSSANGFQPIAPIKGRPKYKLNTTKTFIVTTIEEEPYLMKKLNEKGEPERDKNGDIIYEGFCKDLADRITKALNISYKIQLVKDGSYGAENASVDGGWDGMVGELIRHTDT